MLYLKKFLSSPYVDEVYGKRSVAGSHTRPDRSLASCQIVLISKTLRLNSPYWLWLDIPDIIFNIFPIWLLYLNKQVTLTWKCTVGANIFENKAAWYWNELISSVTHAFLLCFYSQDSVPHALFSVAILVETTDSLIISCNPAFSSSLLPEWGCRNASRANNIA